MARPDVLVPVKVYVSALLERPVEDVWPCWGTFDGLDKVNPAISCTMEEGASNRQARAALAPGCLPLLQQAAQQHTLECTQIGATRHVTVQGVEGQLREYLIALDDRMPFPSLSYGVRLALTWALLMESNPRAGRCMQASTQTRLA